jgi:hypothetical protein
MMYSSKFGGRKCYIGSGGNSDAELGNSVARGAEIRARRLRIVMMVRLLLHISIASHVGEARASLVTVA